MVSVVIVFFDASPYIEEAIQGVHEQTYDNWELILVDDGSTDNSTAIAKRFEETHHGKIRYFEHERHQNKGISASRNLGISKAAGEFIAFLDSDDVWFPDNLEKQINIMIHNSNIGLVFSRAVYWYWEEGTESSQHVTVKPGWNPVGTLIPKILEDDDNTACNGASMFRRDMAVKLGGYEDSIRGIFDDQVLWFKISLNSPVYYNPDFVMKYRIHSRSCCQSTPYDHKLHERINLYSWLIGYIGEHNNTATKSTLLTLMARCKLLDTLLELLNNLEHKPGRNYIYYHVHRLRKSLDFARFYRRSLSSSFSGLLIAGAISSRIIKRFTNCIFNFSRKAYK
jgi:glycosyltransferase involved in cell wall biosynthesis